MKDIEGVIKQVREMAARLLKPLDEADKVARWDSDSQITMFRYYKDLERDLLNGCEVWETGKYVGVIRQLDFLGIHEGKLFNKALEISAAIRSLRDPEPKHVEGPIDEVRVMAVRILRPLTEEDQQAGWNPNIQMAIFRYFQDLERDLLSGQIIREKCLGMVRELNNQGISGGKLFDEAVALSSQIAQLADDPR